MKTTGCIRSVRDVGSGSCSLLSVIGTARDQGSVSLLKETELLIALMTNDAG